MYFLFFSNYRTFSWPHVCWIKDHISQPPLSVAMWLEFWPMGGEPKWCVRILGHTLKSKAHKLSYPFPFLRVGYWCDGGHWDSHLRPQDGSHVLRMTNKTLEAAWGPDPAKPSYLWHKTEKWSSLWFKQLYLWVSCNSSLTYIITQVIRGTLQGLQLHTFWAWEVPCLLWILV